MRQILIALLVVMLTTATTYQPPQKKIIENLNHFIIERHTEYPEKRTMECTAYCGCSDCCGDSCGLTASGTVPTQGRTIAVDWDIIPLGAHVLIDGIEYVVEDKPAEWVTAIDVYFESHQDAIEFGRQVKEVTIID